MAANELNEEARRLVIENVVAGRTNRQIRQKLHDAGHPHELSDATFTHYRQLPDVLQAIQRKDTEAMQSGYAQRSERVLKLALSLERFESRLAESPDDLQFARSKPFDLVSLHKEYRETMKDLGALVDPVKPVPIHLTGANGGPLEIKRTDLDDLCEDELNALERLVSRVAATAADQSGAGGEGEEEA